MNGTGDDAATALVLAKRRFPDHEVDVAYSVGWPVYDVRLTLTVLAEQPIATVARYILRLVGVEATEPAELGRHLGLSDKYVAGASAELLERGLAVQRPDRRLEITEQGKQTLADGGRSWSPQRRYMQIPFDALTRQVPDVDVDRLVYPDQARKNGLFVLPIGDSATAVSGKPRLSEIRIEAVKERAGGEEGINPTEIMEVVEIRNRDARIRYRSDITVVKLAPPGGGQLSFIALRGREYLPEETTALQRLADSGYDVVPEEYATPAPTPWAQSRASTPAEAELLTQIEAADNAVKEAEQSIAATYSRQQDTQDARERDELARLVTQQQADNAELVALLAELERQLAEQSGGDIRLIKTEEHRPLLMEAIDKAKSELTLVSAWIGPDAFDAALCRKLRQAMSRGVQVRIAWGLGTRRGPEADRNLAKGNTALDTLTRNVSKRLLAQLTVKRTETHEKFVICDDQFCVWGSFNWLSYRGEIDRGYRRETSFYSERPDDIALWKANAATLFQ